MWENYAITDPRVTEPAERLHWFVFRLVFFSRRSSSRSFVAGGGQPFASKSVVSGQGGRVGEKRVAVKFNRNKTFTIFCCDERYHVSLQCLRSRNVILVPNTGDTASPERACLQKCLQNDPSDSTSPSAFLPAPKTNSRNTMSARRTNKKSSNRVTSSALVAVSNDAASHLACSDRLILSAARESLLHCDGSSISGGPTSNR